MSYVKTQSRTGTSYYQAPAEVYAKANKTYYNKNKDAIVLKSVMRRLGKYGKIPTKYSIDKYEIDPAEMLRQFEIFKSSGVDQTRIEKTKTLFFKVLQEII
tara:strand:+ start:396 stop:698 length:303 start_codon:yes stop_codon:yes gene_type:complete